MKRAVCPRCLADNRWAVLRSSVELHFLEDGILPLEDVDQVVTDPIAIDWPKVHWTGESQGYGEVWTVGFHCLNCGLPTIKYNGALDS